MAHIQKILLISIISIPFQGAPVISIGDYSTIKPFDICLVAHFVACFIYGINIQTLRWATILIALTLAHMVAIGFSAHDVNPLRYAIFSIRYVLLLLMCATLSEALIDDSFRRKALIFCLRTAVLSILYGIYLAYIVAPGYAPSLIPDIFNGAGDPISRVRGFFTEPSLLILYLTPPLIYAIREQLKIHAIIIYLGSVLTGSSFLIIQVTLLTLIFLRSVRILRGLAIIAGICIFTVIIFGENYFVYTFYDKISTYLNFNPTEDIISDSGAVRKATAYLGLVIGAENFPLGVGAGNSIAELRALIPPEMVAGKIFSEDMPIQSAVAQSFAEYGFLGIIHIYFLVIIFLKQIQQESLVNKVAIYIFILYSFIVIYPTENPIPSIFTLLLISSLRNRHSGSNPRGAICFIKTRE